jgi:hypothetical protein
LLDRRLTHYMRLNARARRAWRTRRGTISACADVFNLLNRRNERSFEYRWNLTGPTSISVTAVRNVFLTRLPTLGVTWEFCGPTRGSCVAGGSSSTLRAQEICSR